MWDTSLQLHPDKNRHAERDLSQGAIKLVTVSEIMLENILEEITDLF